MKIYISIAFLLFTFGVSLHAQNETTLWVDGICGMCEDRIEDAANQVKGVKSASWDVDTRLLTVKTKKNFVVEKLHVKLNSIGHDTKVSLASDEAYDKLHACCKYRDQEIIAAHVPGEPVTESNDNIKSIWVDGICGMCEDRIEEAAKQLQGIITAEWDVNTRLLALETTEDFQEDFLHVHLNSVGHDTKVSLASDKAYDGLHACCKYRDQEIIDAHIPIDQEVVTPADTDNSIWVDGVCGMCEDRIVAAAKQVQGVQSAIWDVNTRLLALETTEDFQMEFLHIHLNSIGHDTRVSLASDAAYDQLHTCCKYRDQAVVDSHKPTSTSEDKLIGEESFPEDHVDNDVHGMIYERLKNGTSQPVIGANIYWLGSTNGESTNEEGYFHLPKIDGTEKLVVSYTGYVNDTIDMSDQHIVEILLKNNYILDEVNITYKKKTTEISFLNTMKVQSIGEKELLKDACCNLSESFGTTPSIDVSFTDAITGTRKIQMLGLAGPYVQVMRENMPYIRGLAALNGFSFTPGTWIESMQLNMGAASVINGPESITGQINVEVKKPRESERLYLNAYANEMQRLEFNANGAFKVNDRWNTGFLIHGNQQNLQRDRNNDGFMDLPINEELIAMSRWKYFGKNGLNAQFNIKGTLVDQTSGQLFDDANAESRWRANMRTERMEGWFKMGKVFVTKPSTSVGFQLNAVNHIQNSVFGARTYDATQRSIYANMIYQSQLGNDKNFIRAGASFQYDQYVEDVLNTQFLRNEILPGVFTEYRFSPNEKWSVIAGLRADHHNNFGLFFTPRLHIKYSPNETTALRFAGGRGQKTASIFAENIGIFASNREIILQSTDAETPYGLQQEIAWNGGVNFTKEVIVGTKALVFSADYYYTHFTNQIVVDFDLNPQEVHIYNLDGLSFAHSIQAQADMEVVDGVDVRVAYRFNEVQTDFQEGRLQKPLTARHRAFLNVGWQISKQWSWDATLNYLGTKRIPGTEQNPIEFQMPEQSPSFVTLNTQVTKIFKKGFEVYLGVENALDYRQENAILSFDDPSSTFFDSSLIWGPIMGRNIYLGFRYKLI